MRLWRVSPQRLRYKQRVGLDGEAVEAASLCF